MKKLLSVWLVVSVALLCPGCALLGGYQGDGPRFWTYNLKQSLARSGGDVAMTMALDQGVDKKVAVGFCEAIIALFQQDANVTGLTLKAKLAELAKQNPALTSLANKLLDVLPTSLVDTEALPPEIKDAIISFLRDGAIYGATMYKDGLRLKMAPRGKEKLD